MRARRRQAQRPRQCRLHRPAPHLLRDAGQLLVRRLLQGRGDRARLEARHPGLRAPGRPAPRHRLCRGRRRLPAVEEDRGPAREPDHPHRHVRQLLGDGRHRSLRPLLRDLLRPRARRARWTARQPGRGRRPVHRDSGTSSSCSTSRWTRPPACRCPGPRSTPAWASSASPPSSRATTTITISTSSGR